MGERPPYDRGFHVAPTLLADGTPEMRVVREEIFGPVVVVVALRGRGGGHRPGRRHRPRPRRPRLVQGVARAFRVARRLRAGQVGVNTVGRTMEAPFGGFEKSGVGRDVGALRPARVQRVAGDRVAGVKGPAGERLSRPDPPAP
ncbi:aldehyde dehydrogenase family protein [Streptomyces sp. NPDC002513]